MRLVQTLAVLVAGIGGLLTTSEAGAEPVYRYCMIGTPNMPRDCTFSTLQQCRMTASGRIGFCQENPAFTASARQLAPAAKRR